MNFANSGSDPGSLEFWEPLLWPALFVIGAVIALMALIFVGTLVAMLVRVLAGFFIFSWWRGPLTVAATALLVWTDVATGTQVVVGWVVALGVTLASVVFLAVAGGSAGQSRTRRAVAYGPCDACNRTGRNLYGSGPCHVCGGSSEVPLA